MDLVGEIANFAAMKERYAIMYEWLKKTTTISRRDWKLLEAGLKFKTFDRGEYFVREGMVHDEIGFVMKGAFRAYYIVKGEEANCEFFFEGQWVKAYHSFLTNTPSRMWIQAMEPSEVFIVKLSQLNHLFITSRAWERFGRIASERLYIRSQERAEMLLLESPENRYLALLRSRPDIFQRVPLYHIASFLGVKQPSLSRIRRRLSARA
jgi:CRP-like cAMP-binding protein